MIFSSMRSPDLSITTTPGTNLVNLKLNNPLLLTLAKLTLSSLSEPLPILKKVKIKRMKVPAEEELLMSK